MELKEKNVKLKKLHSEMNQFVYSLSHELRGPLMSISGISKLAKLEIDDSQTREYFDMIDSATLKLDDYIYKMLDFYRSTKIDHKVAKVDFKEILKQQMEAYHAKFDLSGFNLDLQVSQDSDFFTDDAKIRVILNNLFSNSFQFQKPEPGPKNISLKVNVSEDTALIVIEDNGIGIDAKYHPEVFNLFTRATQKNVGVGLGLYMVKEAVEQMGGSISLESALGEGTKITVLLPNMK
jgi:signal transduction histidine kinase